jgi:hypothetical protein
MRNIAILIVAINCILLSAVSSAQSDVDRSNYANSRLPIWSELTDFEVYALNSLPVARTGNADALLALYMLAAGESRDMAVYDRYLTAIDTWYRDLGMDFHRMPEDRAGQLLFNAMHSQFLGADGAAVGLPTNYSADQSQLPVLLDTQEFNCISSAMLYIVIARKARLEVDGVLVPSHAFVQLRAGPDEVIDIETTSPGGFGQAHDEAFYASAGENWFSDRQLEPPSFADYQARAIVSPVELGLFNMVNQHTQDSRMGYVDRMRLAEIRAHFLPRDEEAQRTRLAYYYREFATFNESGDYDSAARMYEQIGPYLRAQENMGFGDPSLEGLLTAVLTQQAQTLVHTGRAEQGLVLARRLLNSRQLADPPELTLEENLLSVVARYAMVMSHKDEFISARSAYDALELRCLETPACGSHLAQLYSDWALHYVDSGDWSTIVDVYSEYLALDRTSPAARQLSTNLEKAYLNWASLEEVSGAWESALELVDRCSREVDASDRCDAVLDQLVEKYQGW